MNQVSTVGLDLAKHIFQLHGADSAGAVVFRKKLRRGQVLDRAAGRGRGAGRRDPGSAATPGSRPEHKGLQLSPS